MAIPTPSQETAGNLPQSELPKWAQENDTVKAFMSPGFMNLVRGFEAINPQEGQQELPNDIKSKFPEILSYKPDGNTDIMTIGFIKKGDKNLHTIELHSAYDKTEKAGIERNIKFMTAEGRVTKSIYRETIVNSQGKEQSVAVVVNLATGEPVIEQVTLDSDDISVEYENPDENGNRVDHIKRGDSTWTKSSDKDGVEFIPSQVIRADMAALAGVSAAAIDAKMIIRPTDDAWNDLLTKAKDDAKGNIDADQKVIGEKAIEAVKQRSIDFGADQQRKRAQKALEEAQRKREEELANLPGDKLIILNRDGSQSYWEPAKIGKYGSSPIRVVTDKQTDGGASVFEIEIRHNLNGDQLQLPHQFLNMKRDEDGLIFEGKLQVENYASMSSGVSKERVNYINNSDFSDFKVGLSKDGDLQVDGSKLGVLLFRQLVDPGNELFDLVDGKLQVREGVDKTNLVSLATKKVNEITRDISQQKDMSQFFQNLVNKLDNSGDQFWQGNFEQGEVDRPNGIARVDIDLLSGEITNNVNLDGKSRKRKPSVGERELSLEQQRFGSLLTKMFGPEYYKSKEAKSFILALTQGLDKFLSSDSISQPERRYFGTGLNDLRHNALMMQFFMEGMFIENDGSNQEAHKINIDSNFESSNTEVKTQLRRIAGYEEGTRLIDNLDNAFLVKRMVEARNAGRIFYHQFLAKKDNISPNVQVLMSGGNVDTIFNTSGERKYAKGYNMNDITFARIMMETYEKVLEEQVA